MTRIIIIALISIFYHQEGRCQKAKTKEIKSYSYEKLKTCFFENIKTDTLATLYSTFHLEKAKKEKDTNKIAESYLYKSYISDFKNAIGYSDSIITLTQDIKDYYYPALGYMIKGYYYYNEGEDNRALDLYMEALKHSKSNNNEKQQIEIKQFIGGMKYNFGNYDEALKIFLEQFYYIKKQPNYKKTFYQDYLIVLDDLSKTYLRGNHPDSSLIYVKEGIENSIKNHDKEMYHRFLLTSGSSYYFLHEYERALDSLNKLIPTIKDSTRLAMGLYYRGKIYKAEHEEFKAIADFLRVDSIYDNNRNSYIELRDLYKSLYYYYSKNGTEKEQLNWIKKLIAVDSLLDQDFKYSYTKITKDFDLPQLKKEKENLQNLINNNSIKNKKNYILLFATILFAIILILKFYLTQKKYKKRYNAIINSNPDDTKIIQEIISKKSSLDSISGQIIKDITSKLLDFERNNKFLNSKLTLNSLSKELGTNSSYLSKIINAQKQQSFSSYLNMLRINYAIKELKKNRILRNYTIVAIAKEVGYNTSESFSKAFHKEKGIYPSYFIKQLNKKEKA